ncbi:unnamed protein product [Protopolystoma xenopodis]|uniref:Uncharacterized protein n=1 Tax=Protopolystoma xenopodis TaxID=117903 RepID=A0A448XBT0_9PLAT|nr:unnamed protein product [Protopolystoma xenopodis]
MQPLSNAVPLLASRSLSYHSSSVHLSTCYKASFLPAKVLSAVKMPPMSSAKSVVSGTSAEAPSGVENVEEAVCGSTSVLSSSLTVRLEEKTLDAAWHDWRTNESLSDSFSANVPRKACPLDIWSLRARRIICGKQD